MTFLLAICSCRSLGLRNCIWVTYLILGLIQLMVTLVVFAILIVYPEDEECVQTTSGLNQKVTYECEELETKATPEVIILLLVLLGYFGAKISCFVCFLHAFARKIVFE